MNTLQIIARQDNGDAFGVQYGVEYVPLPAAVLLFGDTAAAQDDAQGAGLAPANDGVSPVVIGGNDWAAAWAMTDQGLAAYAIGGGQASEGANRGGPPAATFARWMRKAPPMSHEASKPGAVTARCS